MLVLVLMLMLVNVAPEIIVVEFFWRKGRIVGADPGVGVGTNDMVDDSLNPVFELLLRSVLTHQSLRPAGGSGNWYRVASIASGSPDKTAATVSTITRKKKVRILTWLAILASSDESEGD